MKVKCPDCCGTGTDSENVTCENCEGKGIICYMRVSCPPYKKAEFKYHDYGTEVDY